MSNVTRTVPLVTSHINLGATPAGLGQTALIAGVAGIKYRVLAVAIIATLANTVKFQSASSDITATFPLAANGGMVLPFNEHGWFETVVGDALNVNMGVATATAIQIQYIKLTAGL
jgi:hypothetical protein